MHEGQFTAYVKQATGSCSTMKEVMLNARRQARGQSLTRLTECATPYLWCKKQGVGIEAVNEILGFTRQGAMV